ncbi:MAG: hypothetical protein LAO30_00985 [Acidobacteriia bacterium]|nr:hypothetical protein [Terriglobia bacterium]
MNKRFVLSVIAVSLMLACASFAQDAKYPTLTDAKPMFKAGPNHMDLAPRAPVAQLTQWNGSFKDLTGKTINFTMVGTDPSKTNTSSTIPVYIIPVRLKYGTQNGNHIFDPKNTVLSNGKTVINNIIASPIFDPGVDFTQGGTDLGTTQYIDAFQRGNFWSTVASNSSYHVLLGKPKVLAQKTITVPPSLGSVINNPFGSGIVGTYDINAFDAHLQTWMAAIKKINPGVLPIFITYDAYLTSGGCCIGGYHNANGAQPGGQTYSHATYVDSPGAFSQDVSALSHEIGEWMDDPFVDNRVNCRDNSIMEDGDPLEGESNYGGYPYTLNGFTYNLQSLVFIPYFGAPASTSVHSWLSFQNDEKKVCPGQ